MTFTSRLLGLTGTRAAPLATTTGSGRPPKGGTSSVWYSTPGQPQIPEWDGTAAIRNGYAASIYVMQPVRIIATALGSLPFRVGADPGKRNDYDVAAPMARLLGPPPHGPNPVTSPRNLWIWSIVQRLITGRMAWETVCPAGSDAPGSLWPLVAPFLQPIPSKPGSARWFDGYIYQLPAGRTDFRADEVFYSWRPSQTDWRQPESALQAANMPASLQIALDRYMWALAKNGLAAKKLVITPEFAEDDERRAWEEQFAAEYTGYDNGGRVMHGYYEDDDTQPTAGGSRTPPIQVVDLATSPADAQVLEILKTVKDDMLRTWRVPMSWMGDSSQRTYENASQEAKNFWQGPVMEAAAEIADDVNMYLAPRFGDGKVGWWDFSSVEALHGGSIFAMVDPVAALKAELIVADDWRNDVGLPALNPADAGDATLPAIDDTPGGVSKANFTRAADDDAVAALRAEVEELRQAISEGVRYDVSPLGPSMKPWIAKVGGLPLFIRAVAHALERSGHDESRAIEMAVGIVRNWAEGKAKVTAKTRAKAAAAIAEWDAKKAASHATPNRDTAVTESGSAGLLLPKVGPPMPSSREVHLPTRGPLRGRCGRCGQPATAAIHRLPRSRRGVRHAGPDGHQPVPTGHATARRRVELAAVHRQADTVEPSMARAMAGVFAAQRKATLDRLNGRRGKQMIRAAKQPPEPPAGSTPPPQGGQPAPVVDAGQVFDFAHWVAKTKGALDPVYAAIGSLTHDRLAAQFPADATAGTFGAVQDLLDARLTRLADTVTRTTFDEIARVLHEGVAQGQSVAEMTRAIEAVFDDAEKNRAPTIARTETLGAINHSAQVYAEAAGPDVIAGREWLSAHDSRVRHTHRLADGQVRGVVEPYLVGGFPMMFPGDPAAPPGEVINCRCSQAFLTPSEYAKHTQPAAQAA